MVKEKFRFLENLAWADVAFEAFGESEAELFKNAGLALESVIVALDGVQKGVAHDLEIRGADLETLLVNFLEELVYLQSAEGLVFSDFEMAISCGQGCSLRAKGWGEKLDPERHQLGTEIKGVTLHNFKLEKLDPGFRAQVVLDV